MSILTADEFRSLCKQVEEQRPEYPFTPLDTYFVDADFANYHMALEWWPKDAPTALQLPPLETFAEWRRLSNPQDQGQTFAGILQRITARCTEWLTLEGRDTQHPNETKAERATRKAREAQSRFRNKGTGNPELDTARDHSKKLYKKYQELCAARKQAFAEAGVAINAAYAEYEEAAEQVELLQRGQP